MTFVDNDGGQVPLEQFENLLFDPDRGPWLALLDERQNDIGHWVIVEGVLDNGNVSILDPGSARPGVEDAGGLAYELTVESFRELFHNGSGTGGAVFQP